MSEEELIDRIPSLCERSGAAKTPTERYEANQELDDVLEQIGLGTVTFGYTADRTSFERFRPIRETARMAAFEMGVQIVGLERRLSDDGGRVAKRKDRLSKRASEIRKIIATTPGESLDEKARNLAVDKAAWIDRALSKKGSDRVAVHAEARKRFPSRNTIYKYSPKA